MRTGVALAGVMMLGTMGGCAVEAQVGAPYGQTYADDQGQYDERPGYDERAEAGEYRRSLDPYGEWVDDRTYGRLWRPRVEADWAPYRDGSWGWTRWGWSWIAAGPWAWTFHYGRWVFADPFGWAWYPGTVWGPAWVDWHWNDGWVGWAPLAPFGVVSVNHYAFVNERDFCSPHLRRVIVRERDVPDVIRHHVYERRIVRPPDHDYISRVARDPIQRFDHSDHEGRPSPRRFGRPDDDGTRRRVERPDDGPPRRFEHAGRSFGDNFPGRVGRPNDGADHERRLERRDDLARPRLESGGGFRTPDAPVERRIQRDPGPAGGGGPWGHVRRGDDNPPSARQMERADHGDHGQERRIQRGGPEARQFGAGRTMEHAPAAPPPDGAGADRRHHLIIRR